MMPFIIWGIIFVIAALLVTVANNVSLLGFISVNNLVLRYIIAAILAAAGIILFLMGLRKRESR
ncbi:hypothetical protein ACFLW1_01320 [Chloroflexota bacterium]